MLTTNAIAALGVLVGDPARAGMLVALMDGRALTATELAAVAGVTPQTASSHLSQLVASGSLAMERQGRHRYHRLAHPAVASMVEGLMAVAGSPGLVVGAQVRTGPRELAMRQARTCYDHLAGRVAVAMAEAMVRRGQLELATDGAALTPSGVRFLEEAGIALPAPDAGGGRRRVFCRPCLDWSERRPHVADALGAALLDHLLGKAWVRTSSGTRAVAVTPLGRRMLDSLFEFDSEVWAPSVS